MARVKLEGIYIPVITPFNEDESINFEAIEEIAAFLGKNGVTGIIPSGSTGEMVGMEKEEQIAVNRAYIKAGHANGLKVVASGGVSSLEEIRNLKNIGCDGAIVGKAIFEGKISLKDAVLEAKR